MRESQLPAKLDQDAFRRVWQRVMPEDRADCPFTVDAPSRPTTTTPPQAMNQSPSLPSFLPQSGTSPNPPARPMSSAPPVCLGETSTGELPQLEALLALALESQRVYHILSHQWPREALFARLSTAKLRQLRRLSAAHFLITGKEYRPTTERLSRFSSVPLALRSRHRTEQEHALAFLLASNSSSDPCLIELYRELGLTCQQFAKQIRVRLEKEFDR